MAKSDVDTERLLLAVLISRGKLVIPKHLFDHVAGRELLIEDGPEDTLVLRVTTPEAEKAKAKDEKATRKG